jgi:hypothetical protein
MTEDDDGISGKFVLVVSDIHVGSAYGLLPEGFVGSTGTMLNLNMGQEYLWECWRHFIQDVPPLFALSCLSLLSRLGHLINLAWTSPPFAVFESYFVRTLRSNPRVITFLRAILKRDNILSVKSAQVAVTTDGHG